LKSYRDYKKLNTIIEIVTHNWVAKIICVVLALVIVQIYNGSLLEKKYFSVHLEDKYADGFITSTPLPRIVRVSAWGNTSIINSIRDGDIIARVDASHLKSEGEYTIPIKASKGNSLLETENIELHAEPSEIKIKLEQKMNKSVDVKLPINGKVAEDYEITKVVTYPLKVNIEGPHSRIESTVRLDTEAVNVDDRVDNLEGIVHLINSDPLISIIGQPDIQYRIEIGEKHITKTFETGIYVRGLARTLKVVSNVGKGSVEISGAKSTVNNFSLQGNFLYVDLSQVTEPAEELTVDVLSESLRNGLQIKRISPEKVKLRLVKREEE